MQTRDSDSGFTLIELMIVVLIIGLLASLSYSGYTAHAERAQITDGKVALMRAAQQMEQCYSRSLDYAACAPQPSLSPGGYYRVEAHTEPGASTRFLLEAVAVRGHAARGQCGRLGIDQSHQLTPAGSACW